MSRARTFLLVLAGLMLLALVALAGAVHQGLSSLDGLPVELIVNGQKVSPDLGLASMPPAHRAVTAIGIALALLVALVVVPFAVLAALMAACFALVIGLGAPVVVMLLIALVLLSPLIGLGALIVWALRRPRATIAR
jgi:hypothetical protein